MDSTKIKGCGPQCLSRGRRLKWIAFFVMICFAMNHMFRDTHNASKAVEHSYSQDTNTTSPSQDSEPSKLLPGRAQHSQSSMPSQNRSITHSKAYNCERTKLDQLYRKLTAGRPKNPDRQVSRVNVNCVQKKGYMDPAGPVTALASFPGSGNTWTRQLLQEISGKVNDFQIV